MNFSFSARPVKLLDNRAANRSLIDAQLFRDFPPQYLEEIEDQWASARDAAAKMAGLTALEHAH